jgi:serine/threonine protein kinase
VLNALVYMNALGIIHRDIKPENIFITSNFTIKVGDFGLAIDSNLETPKTPHVGTQSFMAPEICDVLKTKRPFPTSCQGKADVYSVCVMIMEMLTHCVPAHVQLSDNIINITSKGLIRDPRYRPSIASLMNYPW